MADPSPYLDENMFLPVGLKSFYFVYHGATDSDESMEGEGSDQKRIVQGGGTDVDLNDKGEMQALVAGFALRNLTIHNVFCSPLRRAFNTAYLVKSTHATFQIDDNLKDRHFGEHEGKLAPQEFWSGDYPGCELIADFSGRVATALKHARSEHTLFVSHEGVLRVMAGLLKVDLTEDQLHPGCVLHFQTAGPKWTATSLRATFYLVPSQDVETVPLGSEYGPTDTAFSLRSCRGLREILDEYGIPVTRFMHVEQVQDHRDMILEERKTGRAAHGSHCHPWKNQHFGYNGELSASILATFRKRN